MKITRLWLTTIAVLLCSTMQLYAETVTARLPDLTSNTDCTFAVSGKAQLSFRFIISADINQTSYLNVFLDGTCILNERITCDRGSSTNLYGSRTFTIEQGAHSLSCFGTGSKTRIYEVEVTNYHPVIDGLAYMIVGNTANVIGAANTEAIVIPDSVKIDGNAYAVGGISNSAFSGFSNLSSIILPESVVSIGNSAFSGCSSLTSITIPESVTSIGISAFSGCSRLTAITLPEGVTSIGEYAFSGCSSLTSITLSESVTSIGEYAFSGCSSLTSVTLSEGVTSIGNYAFDNCTALKKVIIEDGSSTLSLGYNGSSQGLFYDCPLEEVYLGRNLSYNSVSSYGYSPFYNKDALTNVTIGDEVTAISQYAFYGCDNIHSLTMGNGVLSIEGNTFSTPDKAIWLTNTPPTGYAYAKGSINYVANDQYTRLSNVKVYPYLSSMFEVDGVKYVPVSPSERTCHAIDCAYDSTATVINVGETVSFKGVAMKVAEVMPYAFYGNNYVRELSISHLNAIRTYTFYGCRNLREFIIPDSVKTIEAYCFGECSLLSEITIPQAVTSIGDYVFSGCSQLADVIIEDRTTALALGSNGSSALFADCPLDSVYIGGKITYSTTSSKGYSPFYRNTSLRTVVITNREEQIYDNEFYGCTNLQNVTIGNGVKSIGDYAFSGCSSLDGFSFGSNMESIGTEAFSDCTNLTSITSHAAVPPTCDTQALDDINKWSCTLRVPQNYATAYQAADQWKEFFFIEDVVEVEQYILTYVVDGEVYHTDTLVHKATIVQPETPVKEGYTFSGWSEAPETMPANDVTISGTFIINKYLVTFKIGDEVIAADSLEYGATIVAPEAPEKEGYTFNGWGEVANSVPANDLTYEGSYSVNSYLLTYTVDGDTIQSDSIAYGTAIVLPEEPAKEGHTFSGWSEAPETMPAEDVTISGTFIINKYLVTFKIGDEVIAADSLEYGAVIVAPEAPEKEGYTFNGWGEVAETVPAEDVTYEGSYIVNIYKVYYYVGEELVHTAEVVYGEAIPEYIYEPTGEGDIFEGWVGETYETMPAYDVTYVANITNDVLQLTNDNSQLTIYDLGGRKIEVGDLRELEKGVYIVNGRKVVVND